MEKQVPRALSIRSNYLPCYDKQIKAEIVWILRRPSAPGEAAHENGENKRFQRCHGMANG